MPAKQPKIKTERGAQGTRKLVSRLLAVQAVYEASQNGNILDHVLQDYLNSRIGMEFDTHKIEEPDKDLFLKIARTVEKNYPEIVEILEANIKTKEDTKSSGKKIEPLLRAVLLCGIGELLNHHDIDHPIIINDYLEVTRAFYDKGEVSLVNAVLDSVAGLLRS